MAGVDPKLSEASMTLQREHNELMSRLDALDAALEQIVCYAEIFSDLATANQALQEGRWVEQWLPRHQAYEETSVLETIANMSPELAGFAREMRRQHNEMRLRLESFREHIEHLGENRDLETAVTELKREGKDLTRMMRLHMAREDKTLSGLEN